MKNNSMEANQFDLIVAGAGPGGLMAAAEAGSSGLLVLVLEKNDHPGKKLLATGGGQCNLTHIEPIHNFLKHYHEQAVFAGKSIRQFPPKAMISWFESRGLSMETTSEGKVFPASRKATDVLKIMVRELNKNGVVLRCESAVTSAIHKDGRFLVDAAGRSYQSRYLLIATGGKSYPSLGTTGDGYALARTFEHRVATIRPALAAVVVEEFPLRHLAGISVKKAGITLWRAGKKAGEYEDDLLITHHGLSGPVILNNARFLQSGDLLTVDFSGFASEEDYTAAVMKQLHNPGKRLIRSVISQENIPNRLLETILGQAGIPLNLTASQLNRMQRKALIKTMTGFPMKIHSVGGYDSAMATAGGIATDEVNGKTMESEIVNGLYFAGEVLDVDGMTGGYNLQFAFSSGYAAARALVKKIMKVK